MNEPLKILFTTSEGTLTGATQSLFYLAEGLAQRGHSVIIACPHKSLLYGMLDGSQARRMAVEFKGKFDLASIRAIRDLIFSEKIDIINAQQSADRYISIFAKKLFKLPVKIVHTRRQRPLGSGGAVQRNFYVRNTDKIIVVSESLKRTFVESGYPPEHIEAIYNGMHPSFFARADNAKTAELRDKFTIDRGEVVVGCISRMKNQEQLVRAMQHLPSHYSLFFAGIEEGIFDELSRKLGLKNRIIYAGIIPREEVVDFYRLFDVFVLPSTMDGFGLVLVEAMGLGVPVVATRSQGIIDVLDGEKNGLWFEDGDIEQLAIKIKSVVEDEITRARLIENGLTAAHKKFTIEKTIDEYESFFESLI
ncbi:MAG TPA: glycosyltransferase family 1 protein [candidate division Zixibacteria bacterium]|nr:glycosyltransferase family 1 protein [candidate division Zixibacteria bacterium]